jgi:hypothetical protein
LRIRVLCCEVFTWLARGGFRPCAVFSVAEMVLARCDICKAIRQLISVFTKDSAICYGFVNSSQHRARCAVRPRCSEYASALYLNIQVSRCDKSLMRMCTCLLQFVRQHDSLPIPNAQCDIKQDVNDPRPHLASRQLKATSCVEWPYKMQHVRRVCCVDVSAWWTDRISQTLRRVRCASFRGAEVREWNHAGDLRNRSDYCRCRCSRCVFC